MTVLLAATAAAAGWADINGPVRVGAGEVREGKLSSVNGSITIGQAARVERCSTVNGSISLGADAEAEELSAVNGDIDVERGAVVRYGVGTVNGSISMQGGARAEDVQNVNGRIRLEGAEVARDVSTHNGNIELDGATVGGDIVVRESNGHRSRRSEPLRIVLDGGSVVEGGIRVEDGDLEVEVIVRNGSRVQGAIKGAKVVER